MRLRICLFLLLIVCRASASAGEIRVSECRGAHGERVFSDSAECGETSVRLWILPLQPATTPHIVDDDPQHPRRSKRSNRSNRSTRDAKALDSYLCSSGNQSWYQHGPCRGNGGKAGPIRQSRVSRQQACREIARPAAALRKGSELDERAGPYARATGRDPCR
jgi:hypothetical protein